MRGCSEFPLVLKLRVHAHIFMCVHIHVHTYICAHAQRLISCQRESPDPLASELNTPSDSTAPAGLTSEGFLFCRSAVPDIFR